ncbi:endolytic transglycosylase MltG [bacterium]|nr:endolytic transglycosylase MltG [bacterium]
MAFYSGKTIKEPIKKKSKVFPIILATITLIGVGIAIILSNKEVANRLLLYRCYWSPHIVSQQTSTSAGTQPVTITPGLEPHAIGKLLQEKGVISSANDFLCYVRKINAGSKIQAGYYEISLPVTLEQLIPMLQSARIPTTRIVLPEGLRMDEIAEKIGAAMGTENTIKKFSKQEFLALTTDKEYLNTFEYTKGKQSIEGFLFPDTYDVAKNASAREIVDLLTTTFTQKIASQPRFVSSGTYTPYQVIIMASIIEKEAGKSYEEKQTVAGILEKRIKNGWLLQVDATFLYEKKNWKAPITIQDKSNNSRYNTYKHMGLPPTPIDNPGLDSVRAVLNPKESPYWFYLHGTDGVIRYGRTNEEHLRNISLYLR